MTLKYLIVDDEPIAHDIIQKYANLLPSMRFQKSCYDAIEAIEYLHQQSVDLIFLDLNMPKLKGFDFLRTLSIPPAVIVTTAYQEYALEGYELDIIDYLLKPFSFERFVKAVNKVSKISSPQPSFPHLSLPRYDHTPKRIFLTTQKKHHQILLDDLLYIEASGNYTKVVLTTETITIREKLSSAMSLLPEQDFVQVHRSFVVAIRHIKSIYGNQILMENATIPIGKLYKRELMKVLDVEC
ncbi:MAG: LytTR family DNA-binding domain-containing protein [Bacteroidota bacterium]